MTRPLVRRPGEKSAADYLREVRERNAATTREVRMAERFDMGDQTENKQRVLAIVGEFAPDPVAVVHALRDAGFYVINKADFARAVQHSVKEVVDKIARSVNGTETQQ